ncbi:MAG: ABC transporter ATP-binding protein [Clostridiales bacterium]|nr:ABC transporter ATP-binding protein [Clostridiales bacterium]
MEIKVEHLSKRYGKQEVLKDISLRIPIGLYGLLGENGAGKTTLLRILATLEEPSSGSIHIDGTDIKNKKEIRKIIGYLPQEFSVYPNMSVWSALDYLGILAELPGDIRKQRIPELLCKVHLEKEKNKKFKNLSGGMRRRFGIAQALLNNPKILIVDEPTAGLDPKEREHFYHLFSELAADRIIVLSTHITEDIEATCSHGAVLSAGSVIFDGKMGGEIHAFWKRTEKNLF